jgi:hypothetical protein
MDRAALLSFVEKSEASPSLKVRARKIVLAAYSSTPAGAAYCPALLEAMVSDPAAAAVATSAMAAYCKLTDPTVTEDQLQRAAEGAKALQGHARKAEDYSAAMSLAANLRRDVEKAANAADPATRAKIREATEAAVQEVIRKVANI